MEDQQQINSSVNQSVPQESKLQRVKRFVGEKKLIILIVAVLLVIIIGVVIFFLTSRNSSVNNPEPLSNNPTNERGSFSSSLTPKQRVNVAAQEVVFVEAQKRPDGYYNYVYDYDAQCTDENGQKVCPFGGTDMFETSNTWSALSNFSAYQVSKNESYLNKAVEDIAKLNEYCLKDRAQCLWVLVQPSLIYNETQNPQVLSFLRAQVPALKSQPLSDSLMLAAIQLRAMFMVGDIVNDSALVSLAQSRLPELSDDLPAQPNLYQGTEMNFAQNSCWVALANLYNPDAKYADIQAFLDRGEIEKNFQYFQHPIDIQPCIEAYFILAEKTGDSAHKKTAIRLQDLANDAFFDGKGDAKKVYGNGGYLFYRVGANTKTPGLMVLTDSSYASYLQYLSL